MTKNVTIVCLVIGLVIAWFNIDKQNKKLRNNHAEYEKLYNECTTLQDEVVDLNVEVNRLADENGIFTSMLGEIENEPGGHEILHKLFNQFNTE